MSVEALVIGVGSPHGDDQVGWMFIDQIKSTRELPARFRKVADPVDILGYLDGVCRLIVVDACNSEVGPDSTGTTESVEPGFVHRFEWRDPLVRKNRLLVTHAASTHRVPLPSVLQLAETLGRLPPEVTLFAVEIADCQPQSPVSPAVSSALPELRRVVTVELLKQQPDP